MKKDNAKLFINNKQSEFKDYFVPEQSEVYNIKLKFKKNLTDCSRMFSHLKHIVKIDLSNFNTRYATNMNSMFLECDKLQDLNLSSFNTENVTDMGSMFCGSSNLNKLDLSSFDTRNVTDMSHMFS